MYYTNKKYYDKIILRNIEKIKGGERNESDIASGITFKQKKEKQMQQEEKYSQN